MSKKKKSTISQDPQSAGTARLGQFGSAISQICEEKGISKEKVIEAIESALAAAYKKDYGRKGQHIRAAFDEVTGDTEFYLVKEIVDANTREFSSPEDNESEEPNKEVISKEDEKERVPRFNPERDIMLDEAKITKPEAIIGDTIEEKLDQKSEYGRVAAQTAKQVIIQKIREAERDAMYDEYKKKEGEVLSGIVQRVEGRNVFIDLGKSTGVLFPSEQVEGEKYRIGQRIKVYLMKVEADTKGPGIILSRAHPNLVQKLFEIEVPEIYSKTVEIKSMAREAGSRTKIAVASNEEGVDPIGSCVGQKGTRVQAVIDELGGEKIDIVEWNDDVAKFITNALSPAKTLSVRINETKKEARVTVPSDQLSLAIGKQGQNVRLAAKITGWKIDVTTGETKKEDDSTTKTESMTDQEKEIESETALSEKSGEGEKKTEVKTDEV